LCSRSDMVSGLSSAKVTVARVTTVVTSMARIEIDKRMSFVHFTIALQAEWEAMSSVLLQRRCYVNESCLSSDVRASSHASTEITEGRARPRLWTRQGGEANMGGCPVVPTGHG